MHLRAVTQHYVYKLCAPLMSKLLRENVTRTYLMVCGRKTTQQVTHSLTQSPAVDVLLVVAASATLTPKSIMLQG